MLIFRIAIKSRHSPGRQIRCLLFMWIRKINIARIFIIRVALGFLLFQGFSFTFKSNSVLATAPGDPTLVHAVYYGEETCCVKTYCVTSDVDEGL